MTKERVLDIAFAVLIVLWCGIIFAFSTESGESSGSTSEKVCRFVAGIFVSDFEEKTDGAQRSIVEGMQFFIRKTAHFCAYSVLGFLSAMLLRRMRVAKRIGISEIFCLLYAASDEIHQRFVPGRSGNLRDVMIDGSGALAGILAAVLLMGIIGRFRQRLR